MTPELPAFLLARIGQAVLADAPVAQTEGDSGTVAFAAGASEAGVTIVFAADTVMEGNEGFAVIFATSAPGAMVVDAVAVANIVADNPIVDIAASDGVTGVMPLPSRYCMADQRRGSRSDSSCSAMRAPMSALAAPTG